MAQPATTRASSLPFLLFCLALALALRVPLLGRSVWFDEACMSSQRIGTWEQLLATLYVDIHPPLWIAFMHFWGRCFGDSELALRAPALLSGLATIPLVHWVGRRLLGETAARWGTLLLVLSPVHIWYSVEGRLYAPMVLCAVLSVGLLHRLCDAQAPYRRGLLVLHVLNLLVMCFLHYYLAVFAVALAVAAPLLARGFRPPVPAIVAWHGIALVLLGLFVSAKAAMGHFEMSQDYLVGLDLHRLVLFLVDWCWTGHTLSPAATTLANTTASVQQLLGAALIGLGLVASLASTRARTGAWLAPVGLLLIPCFLLLTAALGYDKTFLERSAIPCLPFVFLLAGAGLSSVAGLVGKVLRGATLGLCGIALVSFYALHASHWTVYKPNSDWRSATKWLGDEIAAGGGGRVVFTTTPNPRSLSYYDPRIQDVKNLASPIDADQLGAKVRARLGHWLAATAQATFAAFSLHNQNLLAAAQLRVYRATPDLAVLQEKAGGADAVFYLLQDEWHPHADVDPTIYDLVENPRVEVLASALFQGMRVYRVRVKPS